MSVPALQIPVLPRLPTEDDGSLPVAVLGLKLVLWEGEFDGIAAAERLRAEQAEQELARLRALLAGPGNPDPPR